MNINSILAVTDFSTAGEHGLERAALIAARHQAKLRLIYGAEVPNLGLADPVARLRQRGRQLARRHGTRVEVIDHTSSMLNDIARHARSANLLVLDHRKQRALPTFWRGTTLEQLLRRCPCPTLVVKQVPRGQYQRVLLAVDDTVASEKLVRYAHSLDAESELELFHTFEALHNAGLSTRSGSDDAMLVHRQTARQNALHQPFRFSDYLETRRNRVTAVTGRSEPAREIAVQQDFARSDLVIVGRIRTSTLIDFLFGNVAERLINLASSDVLVFPHDYQAPSGAVARERIQSLLNRERLV